MVRRVCIVAILACSIATAAPLFNSFNSGELSPLVKYRVDIERRQTGVEQMENMLVKVQGAAIRRPGTEYIASVKDADYAPRLIPFQYSADDSYVIEAGDEYFRFLRTVGGDSGLIQAYMGIENLGSVNSYGVAYWQLDDDTDTNTVTDKGETYDGVSTTNTNTLHRQGRVGTGSFNMDTAYAVEITDAVGLTFDETSKPFSVTAMIYVTDTAERQMILSKWEEGVAREYRLYLDSQERLVFELADESSFGDTNCISQWTLNDNAATTTVIDSQGVQNGVASSDTEDLHVSGKIDGAFDFDGTSDKVTIDDQDVYSFGDTFSDSPFSISAWINMDDATNFTIIDKKNTANNYGEWEFLCESDDKLTFRMGDSDISLYYIGRKYNTALTAYEGSWIHVVATSDATEASSGITLYLNGTAVDDIDFQNSSYTAMHNLTYNVRIGVKSRNGIYANGKIDNVMIFNKELSLAEVQTLYASGSGTEDLEGDSPYATTDDSLEVGWHFIAATYDSTGGVAAANGITFYVDSNVPIDTNIPVGMTRHRVADYVAMEDTVADLRIGSQLSLLSEQQYVYQDKLDNIAIFDKELSSAEIDELVDFTTYEITTTYDIDDMSGIQYVQKNDVMYFCHSDYPVRKLSRINHDYWLIEDVNWIWGPFLDDNTEDITLTPSGTTGSITVTANKNIFQPGHVGSIWKIIEKSNNVSTKGKLDANESSTSIDCEGDGVLTLKHNWVGLVTLEKSDDSNSTWSPVYSELDKSTDEAPTEYSFNEDMPGFIYRVTMSDFESGYCQYTLVAHNSNVAGYVEITQFIDQNEVLADVQSELADTIETKDWAEGAWSEYRGYPRAVCLYQNRLCLAGTSYLPNGFWTSVSGDYENMLVSSLDDGAIVYEAGVAKQNPILWIQDKRGVLAGTADSIIRIFANSDNSVLTGESIGSERQSQAGSCAMQAQLISDSILFVGRNRRKVYDIIYDLQSDGYVSPELTIFAEHITDPCVVDVAVQYRPDPIVWYVKGDGNCVTLAYNREQGVVAWSEQSMDPDITSYTPITNIAQLDAVRNNLDGSYKLMNNIDLSEDTLTGDYSNDGEGWIPIGDKTEGEESGIFRCGFRGIFEGNNKTISGLYINRDANDYQGLFGFIGTAGIVNRLTVSDVNVSGKACTGGLVGGSYGTILNCSVSGIVRGSFADISYTGNIGMLVGDNDGYVNNCSSSGTVYGLYDVGGLVGDNDKVIMNSHSSATVYGSEVADVGGLAGDNKGFTVGVAMADLPSEKGTIINCYATGDVYSQETAPGSPAPAGDIGGLVGDNRAGTIRWSYATGKVSGYQPDIGGLAGSANLGYNELGETKDSEISNCYSTGNVFPLGTLDDDGECGGFLGDNKGGTITNCYCACEVNTVSGEREDNGDFIGDNSGGGDTGTSVGCYYDSTVALIGSSDGGTPKTTTEMKQEVTFDDWDFTSIWQITEGVSYPVIIKSVTTDLSQYSRGIIESIVCIPGVSEDEVWIGVCRTVGTVTRRYIEKFKPQDWGNDPCNCWFVDSGLEYDDVDTNTIDGLGHLEGKVVQVFYDGNSFETETVIGGEIALDVNVSRATIGLPYTSTLTTFPVELGIQGGFSVGYKKKIYEVVGCFYRSMHGQYGYVTPFTIPTMYDIPSSTWPDAAIGTDDPFTGQIRLPIDGGWDDEVRIRMQQTEPYPFNLTALVTKIEISKN